jgi:hypothetical protein
MKVLDAFAYVGGIFNSILALFFFMVNFGGLVYEMKFASLYFKKK